MQMGHGCANDDVYAEIPTIQPGDDLAHELWYLFVRWPDVCRRTTPRTGHLNATLTILARVPALLEIASVEVQVQYDTLHPTEGRILGHHTYVVHGPDVTRQRQGVLILGIRRPIAARHRYRYLHGHLETLDFDRACRRQRAPLPAQAAKPRTGNTGLVAEALAQLVEFGELARQRPA